MPLNTDEWRKMTALHTLEEKGALLEACLVAWAAPLRGNPPATLPDDDDVFETLFGKKLSKVQPVIRQHFRPAADCPGFLRCSWLASWYEEAMARYMARAIAGQKGGKNRGKRAPTEAPLFAQNGSWANSSANSSATAGLQAGLKQLKPNGVITPHTEAASDARLEEQQLPAVDLEAWEREDPDHAAAVQAAIEELCATVANDQRDRARQLFRRQSLTVAYHRVAAARV